MTGNWTLEYTEDGVEHIHHWPNEINTEGVNRIINVTFKGEIMDKEILDAVEPLLKTIQEKNKEINELRLSNDTDLKYLACAKSDLIEANKALKASEKKLEEEESKVDEIHNNTGESMRTNVTTKRGLGAGSSLAKIFVLEFYEVVDNGTDPELKVGDILFKDRATYYVFNKEDTGVTEFYFEDEDLESVRVREFKPGDSFTVTFEEEN